MTYYLASASGRLHPAAPTPQSALIGYLADLHIAKGTPENLYHSDMRVSLGVGFPGGDSAHPVFVVAAPGEFVNCSAVSLETWGDWYELDQLEPVFEYA